jgi:hypothetical protein
MSKRRVNKKPAADRSSRYEELLKAAADRHHTTITDTRAIYEAGVILAHEDQTAQMVAGERIDIATYLRLGEELAKLIPPPEPVTVTVDIVEGVQGIYYCKSCGFENHLGEGEYQPISPAPTTPADSTPTPATNGSGDITDKGEVSASAPVPARPAPPPPPPPAPPRNPSMQAWMNAHGKRYGCPDPGPDPTSKYNRAGYENYANDKPSCWTGYMDGRRPYGTAAPDINPNYNSDGSPRAPHKAPY